MDNRLPNNFEIDRYGVHCRLVNEGDAEFITKLRSDEKLGRFIHASNGDVQKQIEWIKEYKKREQEGLEYYFIFSVDNDNFGLCRIYNIDWIHLSYTGGSWLVKPSTKMEVAMLSSVITVEIAIDILGLLIDIYDVRKDNHQVVKFHRNILKSTQYGETELDYLFMSTPDTRSKSRLKNLLGIN